MKKNETAILLIKNKLIKNNISIGKKYKTTSLFSNILGILYVGFGNKDTILYKITKAYYV